MQNRTSPHSPILIRFVLKIIREVFYRPLSTLSFRSVQLEQEFIKKYSILLLVPIC